ncbi:DUF2996 domain-containing protein [Gloeocapsopsis crepidinum LEGE 06123]|uniref:DUF2996 domain-containing protein n=1 Tax=Gloeocapsopsis crepidinum LEGE 06123 TaxID=588587 RepID=A0ABR9UYY2_9CHRO|nr:DUF2996 domain-containing protein [Gloeocapsopsis crepidinum]MBE9193530.1 DUF2996 domain-containing protein [Gloeocapsopsis crepidinum LEGE 06123]
MADEKTPSPNGEEKPNVAKQAPEGKTAKEEAPPSTVEEQAPSVVAENLHSTDEPETTDIPSANAPDPQAANPEVNPNAAKAKSAADTSSTESEESQPAKPSAKKSPAAKGEKPAAAKAAEDKPAAKAKKEKPPAVEDKPFAEFMQQHYIPALQTALTKEGVQDLDLKFAKEKINVAGLTDECWQVKGSWLKGQRHFNVYFPEESIQGQRALSCYEGSQPSVIEPFLIDERRITLDLMVFGVMQRLNGQKWLSRN